VLDVGGSDSNGSYREIFARPPFRYWVADIVAGLCVDIVLADPYRLPLENGSVDVVVSGQAFEHIEFFWRTFDEMVRVLKPDGFIFLIVPSAGPIHRYPVDCYRFYPDALGALARHAACVLIDSWHDERGPWRDIVGVFRRTDALFAEQRPSCPTAMPAGWSGVPGTPEEEVLKGTVSTLEVLERLHRDLSPTHYLEIGVRHGASLLLARGPATGVDPAPALDCELPPSTRVFPVTSDDFFAEHAGGIAPDFAFIDGMHLVEHALRDFMNIERRVSPCSLVVIDDIFPNHPAQAERERRTRAWTGDVWRLVEMLRRYRPDLFLLPLNVAPAGLLLIAGLDPTNRVLWEHYNPLLREARQLVGPPQSVIERAGAFDPGGEHVGRVITALVKARADNCPPPEIVARLQQARDTTTIVGSRPRGMLKLSIIVIGCNMARELPRTIRSLSPMVQRDIAPEDYEVLLIDNGSTQHLDEAALRTLMPGLTVYRYKDATVSPVPAVNFGLDVARGDLVGIFIDGARMASPGLLSTALAAARLHPRPMIGTIAFHLGPTVQMESIKRGYDRTTEDALLASSGWEADGYRLFSIAAFAGSSAGGWFELPAESNAIFLRAEHWRQLGGWDEGFVTPGGGLANFDTWARVCADPHGALIMLLGEATFHQVHGGIATNNPDQAQIQTLFHQEYVRLRGHGYIRPTRQPLYFGSLPEAMRASLNYPIKS
jgi:hypothetical protein